LPTNFEKGGMKKLVDDKLGRTSFMHLEDAMTYNIEARKNKVEASPKIDREGMIRRA